MKLKLFEDFNDESKIDLIKDVFQDLDLEHNLDIQCIKQSTIYNLEFPKGKFQGRVREIIVKIFFVEKFNLDILETTISHVKMACEYSGVELHSWRINGSGSNYYNDHTNTYVNNDYLIHQSVNHFHIKRPDSVYLSLIKTKDLDIDSIRDIFHDKIAIGTNRTHNISEIKEIIFIFTEKLD